MDNVYLYITGLPAGINEMVAPCADGYTVYIDDKLGPEGRIRAYKHALYHIANGDFEKSDVNEIEVNAHAHSP